MRQNRPSSRHTSVRPTLHALEKRVLLNAACHMSSIWPCTRKSPPPGVPLLRRFPMSSAARERDPTSSSSRTMATTTTKARPGMSTSRRTSSRTSRAWRRTPTRTCRVPGGCPSQPTSPFWVSDQAADFNGSGASSVYKVSDTSIPTSSGPVLTVGVANQGGAPPNPNMTNGPTGQVSTGAPGITTGSTDFLVGTTPRPTSFSPISTARSRGGTGARARRSRRPSPVPLSPGWRSGTPRAVPPRSTPPTRTAATSTSSIASGN